MANQTNVVSCLFTSLLPYHWDKPAHIMMREVTLIVLKRCAGYAHACTHAHTHSPSLSLTHTQTHTYTPLSLSSSVVVTGCVKWGLRTRYLFLPDLLSLSIWNSVIHLWTGRPTNPCLPLSGCETAKALDRCKEKSNAQKWHPHTEVLKL